MDIILESNKNKSTNTKPFVIRNKKKEFGFSKSRETGSFLFTGKSFRFKKGESDYSNELLSTHKSIMDELNRSSKHKPMNERSDKKSFFSMHKRNWLSYEKKDVSNSFILQDKPNNNINMKISKLNKGLLNSFTEANHDKPTELLNSSTEANHDKPTESSNNSDSYKNTLQIKGTGIISAKNKESRKEDDIEKKYREMVELEEKKILDNEKTKCCGCYENDDEDDENKESESNAKEETSENKETLGKKKKKKKCYIETSSIIDTSVKSVIEKQK
jgi:hypothetical protein